MHHAIFDAPGSGSEVRQGAIAADTPAIEIACRETESRVEEDVLAPKTSSPWQSGAGGEQECARTGSRLDRCTRAAFPRPQPSEPRGRPLPASCTVQDLTPALQPACAYGGSTADRGATSDAPRTLSTWTRLGQAWLALPSALPRRSVAPPCMLSASFGHNVENTTRRSGAIARACTTTSTTP